MWMTKLNLRWFYQRHKSGREQVLGRHPGEGDGAVVDGGAQQHDAKTDELEVRAAAPALAVRAVGERVDDDHPHLAPTGLSVGGLVIALPLIWGARSGLCFFV